MILAIRIAKAALVAAIALHVRLAVFGNVTEYFTFVQHVMSMGTILSHSTIGYCAITTPALHHAAYALMITAELLTVVLCGIGAVRLPGALRAAGAAFNSAKQFAGAGLLMGLLAWQVGCITIGGE